MPEEILQTLHAVLQERKNADPATSYVASLYKKGSEKIAAKIIEEAGETAIEAIKGDRSRIAEESADLLSHMMILWAQQDLNPSAVLEILKDRMGTSGHEEKARRNNL